MNEMVSDEQFQEFMNELRSHNKRMDKSIKEYGRNIETLLEEVKQVSELVSSVYNRDDNRKKEDNK